MAFDSILSSSFLDLCTKFDSSYVRERKEEKIELCIRARLTVKLLVPIPRNYFYY